jgi:hypothetical protein
MSRKRAKAASSFPRPALTRRHSGQLRSLCAKRSCRHPRPHSHVERTRSRKDQKQARRHSGRGPCPAGLCSSSVIVPRAPPRPDPSPSGLVPRPRWRRVLYLAGRAQQSSSVPGAPARHRLACGPRRRQSSASSARSAPSATPPRSPATPAALPAGTVPAPPDEGVGARLARTRGHRPFRSGRALRSRASVGYGVICPRISPPLF